MPPQPFKALPKHPGEAPLTSKSRISLFSCKTNFLALLYTKIPQSLPWWFCPSTGGGPRPSGLPLDYKAGREVLYLYGSSALHTKEPGHYLPCPSQPRDFSLCSTQCPHLLNRRKNRTLPTSLTPTGNCSPLKVPVGSNSPTQQMPESYFK